TTYMRRVELDAWYVKNWSLWQDIAIMFKTFPAVLLRRGAC
ncbi:MAG: sugar transferase, partial [Alphaproteobacteria bacterium]